MLASARSVSCSRDRSCMMTSGQKYIHMYIICV